MITRGSHCEECRKQIFHWLRGLVNSKDDAEDLCQEVCLRCISKRPSFRNKADFSTWLYRIAVNVFKDFLRKHSRQAEWLEPEIDEEMLWELWEVQKWKSMANTENQRKVYDALSQLTKHQQQLLIWKYVDGYTCAEIAQQLGISEQSVWQALHRAKQAFKRVYDALNDNEVNDVKRQKR